MIFFLPPPLRMRCLFPFRPPFPPYDFGRRSMFPWIFFFFSFFSRYDPVDRGSFLCSRATSGLLGTFTFCLRVSPPRMPGFRFLFWPHSNETAIPSFPLIVHIQAPLFFYSLHLTCKRRGMVGRFPSPCDLKSLRVVPPPLFLEKAAQLHSTPPRLIPT